MRLKAISVIITAYNAADFIVPCLDSVARQSFFEKADYEILLGIDNCEKTLEVVKGLSIKNLKVFMMKENYGTYIVSNTLIGNARGEYILRFDSDDVMRRNMVEVLMKQKADIVRMRYFALTKRGVKSPSRHSWGQVLFNRRVFKTCGGYAPWRCAADKELLNRAGLKYKIKTIEDRLFYKRMHSSALTKAKSTGRKSKVRKEAHKKLKENSDNQIIKIKREIGEFTIV